MKSSIGGLLACALTVQLTTAGAGAADCASQADLSALKVAALQQELMVAALSCHDVPRYNDFVLTHQPELIASDANLKAYFMHQGGGHGEAGYHTYKTELANTASLRSAQDANIFCAAADDLFAAAGDPATLAEFVRYRSFDAAGAFAVCPGAALELAAASPRDGWRAQRRVADESGRQPDRGAGDSGAPRDRSSDGDKQDAAVIFAPSPHRPIDER